MSEVFGVIGGSGVYDIDSLRESNWVAVKTPFGEPSDEILTGVIGDQKFAFLPRHGRGHRLSPTGINIGRIFGLEVIGCQTYFVRERGWLVKAEHAPGDFILVDQYIDRTVQREFVFANGCVGHVSMAHQSVPISTNGYLKQAIECLSFRWWNLWRLKVLNSPRKRSPIFIVRGVAM